MLYKCLCEMMIVVDDYLNNFFPFLYRYKTIYAFHLYDDYFFFQIISEFVVFILLGRILT
jgi:hypothetical protein